MLINKFMFQSQGACKLIHVSIAGSVAVVVNVLDVNDARPQFLAPAYSLGLDENLPAGFEVGIVSALDADDYPYNQFSFAFQSSGSLSDAFTINSKTGRITTTRSLDREQQETYYLIAVGKGRPGTRVPQRGPPASPSTSWNVNDNRPVFVSPPEGENASIAISPRTRIGTTITQVISRYVINFQTAFRDVIVKSHEFIFSIRGFAISM